MPEFGSPVIALRAAIDQPRKIDAKINFIFVEGRLDRAEMLESVINNIIIPSNFSVDIYKGQTFENSFQKIKRTHIMSNGRLVPTFAFIDPFGWSGVPFECVRQILGYSNCEILATFMYEEINRFISLPEQEENFDKVFGTVEWRNGLNLYDPVLRKNFFHNLYLRQLRESAGAKYVRSFEMRNEQDVTDYYLFYATNNLRGLSKMKEAMWKIDESGEFIFSDATDPSQMILFEKKPPFAVLKRKIVDRFRGLTVSVEEIEHFVLADTAFRETHYKRQILRRMELGDPTEIIIVDPPASRTRGTYGQKSLQIKFL